MTGEEGLDRARAALRARETDLLEQCARGLMQKRYWKAVGALDQLRRTLLDLQDIIRTVNGREEDDEGDGTTD